ncbi:hypothetical protein BDW62DRAFT_193523 [Aspergillus aurantiobrunneus]
MCLALPFLHNYAKKKHAAKESANEKTSAPRPVTTNAPGQANPAEGNTTSAAANAAPGPR